MQHGLHNEQKCSLVIRNCLCFTARDSVSKRLFDIVSSEKSNLMTTSKQINSFIKNCLSLLLETGLVTEGKIVHVHVQVYNMSRVPPTY